MKYNSYLFIGITTILTGISTLGIATPSFAGLIRIRVDPGSAASVTLQNLDKTPPDKSGRNNRSTLTQMDANNDGIVEFSFSPKTQKSNQTVTINKDSDGRSLEYDIEIQENRITLASLEPFEVPNFVPLATVDDLFYTIEIDTLLASDTLFEAGDTFNINNGFIDNISEITFFESSNLLTSYTGSVEVQSFDRFKPIPESTSTLSLITLGTLGAGSTLLRKQKQKKLISKAN